MILPSRQGIEGIGLERLLGSKTQCKLIGEQNAKSDHEFILWIAGALRASLVQSGPTLFSTIHCFCTNHFQYERAYAV